MQADFYDETYRQETRSWWHRGRRAVLASILGRGLAESGLAAGRLDAVDVGCGTGGTTVHLLGAETTVGCDAASEALSFARRRGLQRLVNADASALPFADSSFDLALSLDVLEHHDDDARVASELLRVLRPGGLLLVTVPAFRSLWGPHDVISHHRRRYRRRELIELLGEAGFAVVQSGHFNSLFFPGVWLVQATRRLARGGAPPRPASDLPRHMPDAVNSLLGWVFALERHVVPRWRLPAGVSAFALARRPLAAGTVSPGAGRRGEVA